MCSSDLGGGNQFVDPQVGAVGCEPGDAFLICSDGLIDGLYDNQLEELVRSTPAEADPASPALTLVRQAVENSGRDNATALVIQVA